MTYPLGIPVVYTPLLHHCDPTCHHTPCPKLHLCKSPPCPHSHSLQPAEYQCHCRLSLRMKKCVVSSFLKSTVCWNWSKANSHALTPLMSYWYQYWYDYMDEGSVYYCLIGKHLTLTNDTSIFIMNTVVSTVCLAVCQLELCTIAVYIIQSNQTVSTTKSLYSGCIWDRY